MDCKYKPLCQHYGPDCVNEKYIEGCWVYRTFEGIINQQIFTGRRLKHIFRDEFIRRIEKK